MQKKDALSRKPATWEDGRLASQKPSTSCQLEGKWLYRENQEVPGAEQAGVACKAAQSALTIISKLVMQWSGQHHLDCFSKVNLQLQGWSVPISLRPVPGIM